MQRPLFIRGIEALRVVGRSITPAIVSANTHAAALTIGERGARLVPSSAGQHSKRAKSPSVT
jgi:choline dehydrogenase-like flavoprotein